MKKLAKVTVPILVILVGVFSFVILRATAPANIPKPIEEKQWPVKVAIVKFKDVRPKIFEFGTVVAGNKADLRSLVSGRIVNVGNKYKKGAIVKGGDILIAIDPFDYKINVMDGQSTLIEILSQIKGTNSEIKAEDSLLEISSAQLKLRQRDLSRRQKLRKKGSSSRKSADDAEIAFNEASKEVATRKQSIIRLKSKLAEQKGRELRARSSLKIAKRDLVETKLVAPFDGFLSKAPASVGQYITPADQVATLIEANRLEVEFRLTNRDFISLSDSDFTVMTNSKHSNKLIGKKVLVHWQVGEKFFKFNGVLARLGAEIETTSGGVNMFARLLELDLSTPLRPGAFVEVIIPDKLFKKVVEVPKTALARGNSLFVVENNYLVEKKVDVVRRTKNSVLVRGDLADGSNYVAQIFPEISQGLRVVSR